MTLVINLNKAEIVKRLESRQNANPINPYKNLVPPFRKAGIIIPFLFKNGEWHVTYIRRTVQHGDIHSGQVAFPGGGMEPQDHSILATALREANEEIGVSPEQLTILGQMPSFYSISGYDVTPIVSILNPKAELVASPTEVSRIFTIPLNWLADENNITKTTRTISSENVEVFYYKEYEGEILWGFSARVTATLINYLSI